MKKTGFILLFSLLLLLSLTGCGSKELKTRQGYYFDTLISISIAPCPDAEAILSDAFSLCGKYEQQLSATIPTSEIGRLNAAEGQPVELSESTAELLRLALSYCEASEGLFDITIRPAAALWDFHSETTALPDPAALSSALEQVGYQNLSLEGNTAVLKNGAQLDLGAVAKGYIADRTAEFLRQRGVTCGVLNFGGNVVTIGNRPDGAPWRIGIQRPFDETGATATLLEVADLAVVTSGDYQRCFTLDGKLYHHILDPATGYPAESDLHSATILCADSAKADILSTLCYLLGSEKALAYLETQDGAEGVLICRDGTLLTTSGLAE